MKTMMKVGLLGILLSLLAGGANAANVAVSANIATSTTWTADNVYNLVGQIYVLPGATLTINAGTVVKSNPADQGSLAICRGAKIYVMGTKDAPVIMTSTNDTMTAWHEGSNEWGNLTIMGNALISASYKSQVPNVVLGRTNTGLPDGLNQTYMEGLTPSDPSDTKTLYGGNDDNDSSGEIHYISLRYGGKVVGLGNELNGLSMGGIGRGTLVDHVEIINSVDDAIETWGGKVNYKYVATFNAGDDSFDVDEGWRGKLQFGLFVEGYAIDATRGGGVSDNVFEIDGAENTDAQPCTTATIYNVTAIGQPLSGRGGTAWRDEAHVQYRNSIFMDLGMQLVKFDNTDGDQTTGGYGLNGTLSWADCWTTPYTFRSSVNAIVPTPAAGVFNNPDVLYDVQTSGNLCEISDCVFYNNGNTAPGAGGGVGNAYLEADARGVRAPANNNVTASSMPIQTLTRAAAVTRGGLTVSNVTFINPCAANDAVTSVKTAPADGFFTPAKYRGAFSATNNWLAGWSGWDRYGRTDTTMNAADPDATLKMTATTSFPTVAGVVYTVESSSDQRNWSPIGTVIGDGSVMSVTDLKDFDSAKFYRAIRQ